MLVLAIKICRPNPYFLILTLLFSLHYLLSLFVFDMLNLICKNLHFFEAEIDFLAQFIIKVFIHGCFLIVEHWLERLMRLDWWVLRWWSLPAFSCQCFLNIKFLWFLRLLDDVRHGHATKWRFLFEDSLTDILINEWIFSTGESTGRAWW